MNDATTAAHPVHSMPVVYLVERDPRTREVWSGELTGCGYRVHCFESIAHYVRFPRMALPSCLIVDADATDTEMLRFEDGLRDESAGSVILMSARADIATVVRSIRAGAVDFLIKPLSTASLIGAVRAAIEQDIQRVQARAARARVATCMARLTPRESQLLPLLVSGLLNKQSAARLGITEITVKVHRRHIMEKFQASSLADLVRMTAHLDLPLIEPRAQARTHSLSAGLRDQARPPAFPAP
jgi:FixJ family two-component response regulator